MWIKKQRIIDLESVVRNQQQLILKLLKKEYLGKNVKSGDCTFKVEDISMKDGEIFLHGGKEIEFLFQHPFFREISKPLKKWSICINVNFCELCVE